MRYSLSLIIVLGLLFSCKKESDPLPPIPPVTVPLPSDTTGVLDTSINQVAISLCSGWSDLSIDENFISRTSVSDLEGGKNILYYRVDFETSVDSHTGSVLFKSLDKGCTWSVVQRGAYDAFKPIQINVLNDDTVIILSEGMATNRLYWSFDAGNSMSLIKEGLGIGEVKEISFANSKLGYAGTENGGLHKTYTRGETWDLIPLFKDKTVRAINAISAETVFTIVENSCYKSIDTGNTWNNVFTIPNNIVGFIDMEFYDDQNGVIISKDGLYQTKDGGAQWSIAYSDEVTCCVYENKNNMYLASKNNIYKSNDGGSSWNIECSNSSKYYSLLFFENSIYAAAYDEYKQVNQQAVNGEFTIHKSN